MRSKKCGGGGEIKLCLISILKTKRVYEFAQFVTPWKKKFFNKEINLIIERQKQKKTLRSFTFPKAITETWSSEGLRNFSHVTSYKMKENKHNKKSLFLQYSSVTTKYPTIFKNLCRRDRKKTYTNDCRTWCRYFTIHLFVLFQLKNRNAICN
jgi:hypothetical protein